MENTDEAAAHGNRSLKIRVGSVHPGESIFVYQKTYYCPKDFYDSRYNPSFSPLIYPSQTIHGSVMIPSLEGAVIDEMGFCFYGCNSDALLALVDDLYADGVQGAMRSYGAGFWGKGRFGLFKKEKEYRELASCAYCWQSGEEYQILLTAQENLISVSLNGEQMLSYRDTEAPYLEGAVGIAVRNGSHCSTTHEGCRKTYIDIPMSSGARSISSSVNPNWVQYFSDVVVTTVRLFKSEKILFCRFKGKIGQPYILYTKDILFTVHKNTDIPHITFCKDPYVIQPGVLAISDYPGLPQIAPLLGAVTAGGNQCNLFSCP